VKTPRKVELLFRDRNEQVNDDCDQHLDLDGVSGRSVEQLDPKMLLDQLEEQLHLPSLAIDVGHRTGGDQP